MKGLNGTKTGSEKDGGEEDERSGMAGMVNGMAMD